MTYHRTIVDVRHNIAGGLQMRLGVIRDILTNSYTVSFACTEIGRESLYRHTPDGVPVMTEFIRKIKAACLRSSEFAYLFENYNDLAENDRSIVSMRFENLATAMRFMETIGATWRSVQQEPVHTENETPEVEMGV